MRRLLAILSVASLVASLALAGCSQSAPAPAPTNAPAAPTSPAASKAAEPTKAAEPAKAAEPTKPAAAAAQSGAKPADYPQKGKTLILNVPWDAGGITDIAGRVLGSALEKELGIPVQVINKPGAASQVGITELSKSKPDGYTIGYVNLPGTLSTYLDSSRGAVYNRKSFEPIAIHAWSPGTIAVKADSPYKTLKELVEAAKAKPEGITMSTVGLLSNTHLDLLLFQQAAGVKFRPVHFGGGANEANSALLGGHIDASCQSAANYASLFKGGQIRILGIMDKQDSKFLPGVQTMQAQGIDVFSGNTMTVAAPAGTPKEIVNYLSDTIKKIMQDPAVRAKHEELNFDPRFMDATEVASLWEKTESQIAPLIESAKQQ